MAALTPPLGFSVFTPELELPHNLRLVQFPLPQAGQDHQNLTPANYCCLPDHG